jgi:putative tryptophan/tyrosine transport system substrate-binding protein
MSILRLPRVCSVGAQRALAFAGIGTMSSALGPPLALAFNMLNRREIGVRFLAGLALQPALAAPIVRIPRAGVLGVFGISKDDPTWRVFVDELARRGFVEGRSIIFVERHSGEALSRLDPLASELVSSKVDIIITTAGAAVSAALRATKTIPIVSTGFGNDPVRQGWIASLARPGGNLTGPAMAIEQVDTKKLEILIEAIRNPRLIAVTRYAPTIKRSDNVELFASLQATARIHGAQLKAFDVPNGHALDDAFAAMVRGGFDGVLVDNLSTIGLEEADVGPLLLKHRLPGIMSVRDYAAGGVLFTYGAPQEDHYRKAAVYVAKILQGARPADLPVELPTHFEFVVNLRTAMALGLTVPPSILLRADEVIR